jgi:hypothetical protein
MSYVDISISTPLMDEVVVACTSGRNNNARDWAIYVGAIADPGGDTIHACSSLSSKLMVWVSAVCHHLQDVAPLMQVVLALKRLSPLPSCTLRPVFVQGFFFFLFSVGHSNSVYLSVHQDDISTTHFFMATTTFTLTSAILVLRSYHLLVILISFYSSHNIHTIMTL